MLRHDRIISSELWPSHFSYDEFLFMVNSGKSLHPGLFSFPLFRSAGEEVLLLLSGTGVLGLVPDNSRVIWVLTWYSRVV